MKVIEQAVRRVVENHSLGKTSFGRKRNYVRQDASPSEWFSTTRISVACLLLLASFVSFNSIATAQTIDRQAIFSQALPLYEDNAQQPLGFQLVGVKVIGIARMMRFSYLSTNNQRIPALLFMPLTVSNMHPAPCLILLHGLGGSKEQMAGLALTAASKGYASLAIDEYGQGERAQVVTDTAPKIDTLALAIRQSVVDVRRGLDYLATRPNINSQRIGLVGVSFGAIIGTVAAGVDTRIKASALVSGGGDLPVILKSLSARNVTVGGRKMGVFAGTDWTRAAAALAPEDPLTFASHIAPRALLMECGRKDAVIIPRSAQELYAAAQQPKQIDWYGQYGHVPPPEIVYPAIEKFFAARL